LPKEKKEKKRKRKMQLLPLFTFATLLGVLTCLSNASPTPTPTVITSSSFTKRDAAAVVSAVNVIGTQLTTLNNTVNSYSGGLLGTFTALKIQLESSELSSDLQSAIKTTQQSANFTETESASVATAFLALEPKVISVLNTIVAKKSDFETGLLGIGSLTFLVKDDLVQQQKESAELGDAVMEKLTTDFAALAPVINQQIAEAFETAIKQFG
jgi:hypothetical protein